MIDWSPRALFELTASRTVFSSHHTICVNSQAWFPVITPTGFVTRQLSLCPLAPSDLCLLPCNLPSRLLRLSRCCRPGFMQQRVTLRKGRGTKTKPCVFILLLLDCGHQGSRLCCCFCCCCESWSRALSPRPLFRCQFTWWAELLCIYLHCHMYSNWWVCLWDCCSKQWLFLSGLYNTIMTGFTRYIKVCLLIGMKHLLHTLKHISVIYFHVSAHCCLIYASELLDWRAKRAKLTSWGCKIDSAS